MASPICNKPQCRYQSPWPATAVLATSAVAGMLGAIHDGRARYGGRGLGAGGSRGRRGRGAVKGVRVGEREIALYHLPGGEYRATDNICTHEYAQLSDGWLEDGCIECPLHAARFDVRSGKALCAPAEQDIDVFETRVEGADLLVKLPG